MKSKKLITLAIVIFVLFTNAHFVNAQKGALKGFDKFVENTMKEWKIPGLAIAVIQDDKVIHAKGYGFRDIENKLPVTPNTLFAIGSITKSFTVTSLGMLNDDGKLEWDEPVHTYLPAFQLHDLVASEHMNAVDLVTHRSGLPRHDFLWYGSDFTREEMFHRLKFIEPSEEFRIAFQYQNLMYMTAGYLAGQISSMTWETLVQKRILDPLGMKTSNFSVNKSKKMEDFAYPYTERKDKVQKIPFRNIDEIGPAGSINSSVNEMIRYVQLHINKGKFGEEQLLSDNNAIKMQTPQMVMGGTIQYDELGHNSYGMGLFITTYQGQKMVQHGGGIDGFISLLSFLPRKKMGAIVLTNFSGNNPVPTIVTRNVYDRLLEVDQVDWVSRVKEQQEKAEKSRQEAKEKKYSNKKVGTSPSHELADYVGSYEHPGYGVVNVENENSHLKLTFNQMSDSLKHFHYDIFEIPEESTTPFANKKVRFDYDENGNIDRVFIPFETQVDQIIFTRIADAKLIQKEYLQQFVAEYELASTSANVELKGDDQLTLTVPGQPTYTLVPIREFAFELKGLKGYSVEFKKNDSDEITEVVFFQPNGTFVAKRKK